MSGEARDVKPFSNGSEADYWRARNCDRCALNTYIDELRPSTCDMEEAIALGYILGTVPADLAIEYGATVDGKYCKLPAECPKLELRPFCEYVRWPNTRRASKCERAASSEVVAHGARRAVCPRHAKACASDAGASS